MTTTRVRTDTGSLEFRDPPWVPTAAEIEAYRRAHPEDGAGCDLLDRLVRAHRLRVEQLIIVSDVLAEECDRSQMRRAIALAALATAEMDLATLPDHHRAALAADVDDDDAPTGGMN